MSPIELQLPEKHFFKIGEVCKLLKLQAHVLRYWEEQFEWLDPEKTRTGQRVYSRKDVQLLFLIQQLLHTKRYTIEGAIKLLKGLKTDWEEGIRQLTRSEFEEDNSYDSYQVEMANREMFDDIQKLERQIAQLNKQLETLRTRYSRLNQELLAQRTRSSKFQKIVRAEMLRLQELARKERVGSSIQSQ